jgi:hypothetical protein
MDDGLVTAAVTAETEGKESSSTDLGDGGIPGGGSVQGGFRGR